MPNKLHSLALLFCLTACSASSHADLFQKRPEIGLRPQLNGLNVAYHSKSNVQFVKLFVINHEDFNIICDAQFESGPVKKSTRERVVDPGKATEFRFNYGRHTGSAYIRFICIPENNPQITDETVKEGESTEPKDPPVQEESLNYLPHNESVQEDPMNFQPDNEREAGQ